MLPSCSSFPPHTSHSQFQSFSRDLCLKEIRRREDPLYFIESTCFRRGRPFTSSMCVLFLFFSFISASVCLPGITFFEYADYSLFSFIILSSRRFLEILSWYVIVILFPYKQMSGILVLDLAGIRYIRSQLDCMRSLCMCNTSLMPYYFHSR